MLCLIGHSASGKTTCERELEKRGWNRIISYTTRPIRNNEQYDVDYHYISREEFIEKLKNGFFAENTRYRGWFYGIAKSDCIDDAIAVVEPIGFRKLKKNKDLNVVSIFLDTSESVRIERMARRGDDTTEIFRRIFSDQGSFACIDEEVDYIVENQGRIVEETVDEIIDVLEKERIKS
jgi:guanylate kinase